MPYTTEQLRALPAPLLALAEVREGAHCPPLGVRDPRGATCEDLRAVSRRSHVLCGEAAVAAIPAEECRSAFQDADGERSWDGILWL
jgi:hypothetical protein